MQLWRGSPAWRRRIEAAYSEPHRRYHTLAHLDWLFADAEPFLPLDPAVEWAIWFHDYVYDPRSATNEEDSARVAVEALREMAVEAPVAQRAAELILATKHTLAPPDGDDARLLVSLDLAILAAPEPEYDAYVEAVRFEYAHVSEDAFRAGRAAFMRRFLAQAAIFPHPAFAGREAAARANITREVRG